MPQLTCKHYCGICGDALVQGKPNEAYQGIIETLAGCVRLYFAWQYPTWHQTHSTSITTISMASATTSAASHGSCSKDLVFPGKLELTPSNAATHQRTRLCFCSVTGSMEIHLQSKSNSQDTQDATGLSANAHSEQVFCAIDWVDGLLPIAVKLFSQKSCLRLPTGNNCVEWFQKFGFIQPSLFQALPCQLQNLPDED